MSILAMDTDTLQLDPEIAKAVGKSASESYRGKQPYPYGGFDDFLPAEVLDHVLEELQTLPEAETTFNRPQEKRKPAARAVLSWFL